MDVENVIVTAPMLLIAVALPAAIVPRIAGSRTMTITLTALTALIAVVAHRAILNGWWWNLALAAVMGLTAADLWDIHVAVQQRRPPLTAQLLRRFHLWRYCRHSIAELRAMYAQPVLDDAERDPILSDLIDEYGQRIMAEVPKAGQLMTDMDWLLMYVNGYVDGMGQPGRRQAVLVYGAYSMDTLMVAAACRVAERLQTSAR